MNIFISSFIIIILLSILYNLTKKNIETFASNNDYYKNKVVIITGSTNGIGLSLAKTFSKTNCKLVIHGRDETRVKNTVALLNKSNKNILGIVADLSDESNFDAVIQKTIEKFNKIDILINNIINRSGSNKIIKKEYKDWKMEMNVNINSIFYLTKKVVENMRYNKIKGKIINISSNETKERSTKVSSGTQILSKTFIERMSELLSEETEK